MPDNVPSEDIQQLLQSVVEEFDKEDRAVRDRQIRLWRRMKLYWDGFQRVWWSEVAHDWRIADDNKNIETDHHNDYYDKPVNVFRAYLETIIAALSVTIPPIQCIPDDADNPMDLSTAKAGNRIAELVIKHNDAMLVWVHALWVYCTEGLVCFRNYTHTDESYGTYHKKEEVEEDVDVYHCPHCQAEVNEAMPDIEDRDELFAELECPECGELLPPDIEPETKTITRLVGITDEPKSRQIIEAHGGLYVKVPVYARTQRECPYLFYSYEENYVHLIERYKHLDSIKDWQSKVGYDSGGVYDPYERWGRLNPQYYGEYPINTVTKRQCWLRPEAFNVLDEDQRKKLRDKYPKGVCVVLANDEFCEAYEACLDDEWTLTRNPLSDYLHHDPLGLLLTSIQDITNELVSLVLQTIEHGIPQTFADPAVVNFAQYSQTEATPGTIYAAKPAPGKAMRDAFYEVKTATLSQEVLPFGQKIQEMGQLVVGALPSLFGGAAKTGSNTAAEYSMSRAQALQRLQTPWKMMTVAWKTMFGKVIPAYMRDVHEDERFVERVDTGRYINIVIRKADLYGKIGSVELEANEQLPQSWTQLKDSLMQLMEMQVPAVMEALTSPENLPFIKATVGLDQFVIPGEADRQKQYEEIDLLLQSSPIPDPSGVTADGQPRETLIPSVEIDPDVDNNPLQAEICRSWLISEAGQLAKQENPEGYQNVLLHMRQHRQAEAAALPPAAEGNAQPSPMAAKGVENAG